ncbi:hypothetical protein [Streptomyces sp. NPDC050528]|uniref:hypothetical protein n=1 Tax=Streptomyces sp. NPDC050528 TaxID=3365623 RepID=UPI0037AFB3B0
MPAAVARSDGDTGPYGGGRRARRRTPTGTAATARREACAAADQDDPGISRFLLPDLVLTCAEIAARRGGWGRLCETAYTPRDLADEAIHLTSASTTPTHRPRGRPITASASENARWPNSPQW